MTKYNLVIVLFLFINVVSLFQKNKVLVDTKFDNSSKNFFWSFINNNTNSVVIKNINGCYIQISSFFKITCIDSFQNASQFYFLKIYEEVNHTEEDIKLLIFLFFGSCNILI